MNIFDNLLNDLMIMFQNFFVHKNFLPEYVPGKLFTPIQIFLEILLIIFIIWSARYVAKKRQDLIIPIFKFMFFFLVIFEIVIVTWDTVAGGVGFDFQTSLSLYPCSIFMYVLPFIVWNKGIYRQMACGYISTLGLIGALINFLYPFSKLTDYSMISFASLHTFTYHGSMLFAFLVIYMSGMHNYKGVKRFGQMFLASMPGLLLSIPANIINYSPLHADYMYFTNQLFISKAILGDMPALKATLIMYAVYLILPAIFYVPSYLRNLAKRHEFSLGRILANLISISN